MAERWATGTAEKDAGSPEEPGVIDLTLVRPAGGAIGGDEPVLARAPQRADDGRGAPHDAAGAGQHAGPIEDIRSVCVVVVPPLEQLPRLIDRRAERHRPGLAELDLVAELGGGPLRRRPEIGRAHV